MSTAPGDAPFDAGLQPERTLLSWRRTSLSMAVAGLLIIRFATDRLGAVAIVLGMLGLLLAAAAHLDSARRYRRTHRHLTAGDASESAHAVPSAAVPVTLAAAAVAVFAVACVVWLIVGTL